MLLCVGVAVSVVDSGGNCGGGSGGHDTDECTEAVAAATTNAGAELGCIFLFCGSYFFVKKIRELLRNRNY